MCELYRKFGWRTEADREADWGEINGEKDRSQRAMPKSQALGGRRISEAIHCESQMPVNLSHHITAYNSPHSISSLLLIIPAIHRVRQQHVHGDVQLIHCSEKYTLTCLTVVTYQIRDCNLNGSSLMSCHLACVGEYLIRLHHYKPPLSIYVSFRVNEQWLSFEPESRAVISLPSNTPTGSNDAKTCLAMPEHEPFEDYEEKKMK